MNMYTEISHTFAILTKWSWHVNIGKVVVTCQHWHSSRDISTLAK